MLAREVETTPTPGSGNQTKCGLGTEHLKSSLADANRQQRLGTTAPRDERGDIRSPLSPSLAKPRDYLMKIFGDPVVRVLQKPTYILFES